MCEESEQQQRENEKEREGEKKIRLPAQEERKTDISKFHEGARYYPVLCCPQVSCPLSRLYDMEVKTDF